MVETYPVRNLQSRDLRELHAAVAKEYFPHELRTLGGKRDTGILKTINLGPLTLGKVSWGVDVSLDCEYDEGAYEVNIVLDGALKWEREGKEYSAEPGQAAVFAPGRRSAITSWPADTTVLGIKMDRDMLHRDISRAGLSTVGLESVVAAKLDLRSTEGRSWLNFIRFSAEHIVADPAATSLPQFRDSVISAVSTPMVNFIVPENFRSVTGPFMIRKVQETVETDLGRRWSLDDLALVSGVGRRRLQQAFKDYVGLSPMTWLLQIRLERAYQLLATRTPDTAIHEIAYASGFNHLGRFAQDFRERYGHAPSETPQA